MKCKCKWSMSQVLLKKNSYPCFATQTFFPINKSNCLKFESECLFLKKKWTNKKAWNWTKCNFLKKKILKSLCPSSNPVCLNQHT